MLENLERLNIVMKDWFDQPTAAKRKELAISMASHGFVKAVLLSQVPVDLLAEAN